MGNAGNSIVSELARLYKAYAEGSALECVALKATSIMPSLLLQRPHRKSKTKDHIACLTRRMALWREGEIYSLLVEGKTLQQRLPQVTARQQDTQQLARSFANLMFEGKIKAALQLLSKETNGGLLRVDNIIPTGGRSNQFLRYSRASTHQARKPHPPPSLSQIQSPLVYIQSSLIELMLQPLDQLP